MIFESFCCFVSCLIFVVVLWHLLLVGMRVSLPFVYYEYFQWMICFSIILSYNLLPTRIKEKIINIKYLQKNLSNLPIQISQVYRERHFSNKNVKRQLVLRVPCQI